MKKLCLENIICKTAENVDMCRGSEKSMTLVYD